MNFAVLSFRTTLTGLCLALLCAGTVTYRRSGQVVSRAAQPAAPQLAESYGKLPLSFEANQGQAEAASKYLARGYGYDLALTAEGATLHLQREQQSARVQMRLLNARPPRRISGAAALPGKVNYLLGADAKRWQTGVPTFAKVEYEAVYAGIDLVWYGNQQQLEYDFVVAPGADPRLIHWRFDGAQRLQLDAQGDLLIATELGALRQHKPVLWQTTATGTRESVSGAYRLTAANEVAFEIGAYDATRPLVIDPAHSYATFLRERTGTFALHDIAVDAAGNTYLVGMTAPALFPDTTAPTHDGKARRPAFALVIKLNPPGTQVLYATLIGGTQSARGRVSCESTYDESDSMGCYRYDLETVARTVTAAADGTLYLAGDTLAANFPVTAGAYQTAFNPYLPDGSARLNSFALKLNAAGNQLVYATLFDAGIKDLAPDAQGRVWLTGTTSEPLPTTANAFQRGFRGTYPIDAYVAQLNQTGSALLYASHLGSGSSDTGFGVAVDAAGNAYVTGLTLNGYGLGAAPRAAAFPTTAGAFRTEFNQEGSFVIFVTKFNADGSLGYSTLLGVASDSFYGPHLAVDAAGQAFLTGTTRAADFPVTPGVYQTTGGSPPGDVNEDAFVTKLNASGSALVYSTFLGPAAGTERGLDIKLDALGNAIIAGRTVSNGFPLVPATNPPYSNEGGFVTKFNAAGSGLIYSFVFDQGVCTGVAVDPLGHAYTIGYASNQFPTTPNVYLPAVTSATGWLAAKIDENAMPTPPTRFIISGRTAATSSATAPPVPNVTIRLTGAVTRTATTNSAGLYQFDSLPAGGNYTVTPAPPAGTVSVPTQATFNNLSANQAANFIIRSSATPTPTPVPTPTPPLNATHVSAATYDGARLGRESIVAAFGVNLATATQAAQGAVPPTALAGTTVKVKDEQGVERLAPLFFVSPTQINYQLPAATSLGTAFITITNAAGVAAGALKQVDFIVPGLFTVEANGRGLAAAVVLRVNAQGQQSFEPVARFDQAQNRLVAVPIDLGAASDEVYVVVFGTGFRFHSGLAGVEARLGGVNAPVIFAGAQGELAGLDQANVRVPRTLLGRGEVELLFSADGRSANTVKLWIK